MTGQVVFQDGVQGEIRPEPPSAEGDATQTGVRLEDGRQIVLPTDLFVVRADGRYAVPLRAADLPPSADGGAEETVIPIVEETLEVRKRRVETGRVRLTKTVQEHTQIVDEPLMRGTVSVSRVPIGRLVDAAPAVRSEGDTTVIPVLEEVLVVEKRLMLVEEVRVTQQQAEVHAPQQVVTRREHVEIERLEPTAERRE